MKFNTYSTDLQILCESTQDHIDLALYCSENKLKLEKHFSNVEGQEWHGKQFYEIPFCSSHENKIRTFIHLRRIEEMLREANELIINRSKKLLASEAIDLSSYNMDYILPKIVLCASLDLAKDQYMPLTSGDRNQVRNLIKF